MKEIQGKIKFGVTEYINENETTKDGFNVDTLNKRLIELEHEDVDCFWLSKITEEQADEFVEWVNENQHYVDYIEHCISDISAKESLISLLKANGILSKGMGQVTPMDVMYSHRSGHDVTNIPDDLLLIKLT